jgi:hypothetical protein
VENFDFFHKISGLRDPEPAGKGLYLARTKPEQKIGRPRLTGFFTSHPVDIHQVFHRPARFFPYFRNFLAFKTRLASCWGTWHQEGDGDDARFDF